LAGEVRVGLERKHNKQLSSDSMGGLKRSVVKQGERLMEGRSKAATQHSGSLNGRKSEKTPKIRRL